ncbi:polyprenyl synthetase family protein [soil metagenome]
MSTLDARALRQLLDSRRAAVDSELGVIAAHVPDDDPVFAALRYALVAGGKRLRPVLCLAAAEAVRAPLPAEEPARLRAAAAIELVHTYSLMHDDLPCMDNDDLRRGRPTAHRVFGTKAAMTAAFALIPLSCRVLADAAAALQLPPARCMDVVRELCLGAGAAGMVGGQVLDLEFEGSTVSLQRLRTIHGMKTGALFRASLRIGGLLAGGSVQAIDALGDFGERLGLAFQITDDVLDVTMDTAALGKTPGKDRDARKATFSSLLGVPAARASARDEIDQAIACLRDGAVDSPFLEALARFAVERDR